MMRLIAAVAAAALLISTSVFAADEYEDGIEAYRAGDFESARQAWEPLAEQGDPRAQFSVGSLYAAGEGVTHDPAQAAILFRRSAEQGYAPGQYAIGVVYDQALGVPEDNKQAQLWYLLAAKQGHAAAQNNLCEMLATGEGGEQNWAMAVLWCARAAQVGEPLAAERVKDYAAKLRRLQVNVPVGNLRSERSTRGAIVGKLRRGDVLYQLDGPNDGWYQVYVPQDHVLGFVSVGLVRLLGAD